MNRVFTSRDIDQIGQIYRQRAQTAIRLTLFKIGADTYSTLAGLTPVKTGYLRLSLGISFGADISYIPPERNPRATEGYYVSDTDRQTSAVMTLLTRWGLGDTLRIGYTAEYAPYVEDYYHMVKQTKALVPSIVRGAKAALMQRDFNE